MGVEVGRLGCFAPGMSDENKRSESFWVDEVKYPAEYFVSVLIPQQLR